MLQFKQSDTAAILILTLTELETLTAPNYLFIFEHTETRAIVAFVKLNNDDLSLFKDRYNKFSINPAVVFSGKPVGEWHYTIYEQASDTNTDPAMAGGVLELGKMIITRETEFAFAQYDSQTTFKAYDG